MPDFLTDLAVAARLQADYSGLELVIDEVDPGLLARVDRQLLESALMNLLGNGFKYSRPGGRVTLRAREQAGQVNIEVEDECGGIDQSTGDPFQPFGDRRGQDRTGLGLGLSIARKAVRAQGGDITIRNIPGQGCVFTIAVPLVAADVVAVPPTAV